MHISQDTWYYDAGNKHQVGTAAAKSRPREYRLIGSHNSTPGYKFLIARRNKQITLLINKQYMTENHIE